jgi:hypothetical protein
MMGKCHHSRVLKLCLLGTWCLDEVSTVQDLVLTCPCEAEVKEMEGSRAYA